MKIISGSNCCHVMICLVVAALVMAACEAKNVANDAGQDSGESPDGEEDGGIHEHSDAVWPEDFDENWPEDLQGSAVVTLGKHTINGSRGAVALISFRDKDVTVFPAGPDGTSPEPVGIAVDELSRIGYIVYTANTGTGSVRMLDISMPDPLGASSAAVYDPGDPPEVVAYKYGMTLALSGKSNILYVWNIWDDTTQSVPLGESGVTLWDMTRKDWAERTYVMDNTGTASGRGSIFILDRDAAQLGRVRYEDLDTGSSGPLMAAVSGNRDKLYVVNSHTDDLSYFRVDEDSLVHVSDHPLAPSDFSQSHGIAISGTDDRLYLLADNTHEVLAVSTADFSVERYPLDKSDGPSFFSLGTNGRYLLVPSPRNDCIYVLDCESGQPVLSIPLPESSEPRAISGHW